MKILNICHVDYAGVGINLTEAVNQHTNHKARHLCEKPHHFKYKVDICTKDSEEMRRWIKWADVVNCHVYTRPLAHAKMVPPLPNLIMTQHGSYFRSRMEKCRDHNRKWGAKKILCTTPDLVKYGAEWIPTAIPQKKYAQMRKSHNGVPIVCQSPSNPDKKNTPQIEQLFGNRRDLRLRIVHHTPHDQVLRQIAEADIFIDRFRLGLGVSGFEAAAMGIPVIACASVEDEALIIKEVGYLPYYKASLRELEAAVDALLSNKSLYAEYAERGRQYILDFHDYPVVARRYEMICRKVLGA